MLKKEYLNDIIKRAHANAIDKGWWEDGDRPIEDIVNLILSETAEALEELRSGHKLDEIYYNGEKPEGFIVELADVVIRIADYLGRKNIEFEYDIDLSELEKADSAKTINESLFGINASLILSIYDLRITLGICFVTAKKYNLQLQEAIEIKMAYNTTRPRKHGRSF